MIIGWEQEMMKRADNLFARGSSGPPVEDAQSAIAGRARGP
jgi:hypothetical protein